VYIHIYISHVPSSEFILLHAVLTSPANNGVHNILREIRHSKTFVHSDLFFIRSGTRIISPIALYRDDDRTQQDGYARDNISHRDGSYGSAWYRSFSVERGVHNPTHDGLLGTAPRLIMHRSASFSFRRYC